MSIWRESNIATHYLVIQLLNVSNTPRDPPTAQHADFLPIILNASPRPLLKFRTVYMDLRAGLFSPHLVSSWSRLLGVDTHSHSDSDSASAPCAVARKRNR